MTSVQPFVSPKFPPSFSKRVVEKKEAPKIGEMKAYEYKDATGKVVCKAEIKLASELEDLGSNRRGRRVLEYKLLSPDGRKTEVDLLRVAKAAELGTPMFAYEGDGAENAFSPEKNRVIITLGGTLLDVVTALHEFGHAAQQQDPRFSDVNKLVPLDGKRKRGEYIEFVELQLLKESIDVSHTKEDVQAVREYGEQERRAAVLKAEITLLKNKKQIMIDNDNDLDLRESLRKLKEVDDAMAALQDQIKKTEDKRKELIIQLEEFIRLPKIITERDATARAFKNMRQVRLRDKLDLFKPVVLADTENTDNYQFWNKRYNDRRGCADEVRAEVPVVDVSKVSDARSYFVRYALWGYSGSTPELRNRYGDIPRPAELEEIDDFVELAPNTPPLPSERSASSSLKASLPPPPPLVRPRNVPPPLPPIAGTRKSPPTMSV